MGVESAQRQERVRSLVQQDRDLVEEVGCPSCANVILSAPCGKEYLNYLMCFETLGQSSCSSYFYRMSSCGEKRQEELNSWISKNSDLMIQVQSGLASKLRPTPASL